MNFIYIQLVIVITYGSFHWCSIWTKLRIWKPGLLIIHPTYLIHYTKGKTRRFYAKMSWKLKCFVPSFSKMAYVDAKKTWFISYEHANVIKSVSAVKNEFKCRTLRPGHDDILSCKARFLSRYNFVFQRKVYFKCADDFVPALVIANILINHFYVKMKFSKFY